MRHTSTSVRPGEAGSGHGESMDQPLLNSGNNGCCKRQRDCIRFLYEITPIELVYGALISLITVLVGTFVIFLTIWVLAAYLVDGAGESIRLDPESCTRFPNLFICFLVSMMLGVFTMPCFYLCQDKEAPIPTCWMAMNCMYLVIVMLLWVLEAERVSQNEECQAYIGEKGSDLFWMTARDISLVFSVTLMVICVLMFLYCMKLAFCTEPIQIWPALTKQELEQEDESPQPY